MSEMQIVDQSLNDEKIPDTIIEAKEGDSDLNQLIKENLALTREIAIMVRHINRYVAWQRIFAWVKVLFILIPVIVGAIYLPPLLNDAYKQLLSVLGSNIQ